MKDAMYSIYLNALISIVLYISHDMVDIVVDIPFESTFLQLVQYIGACPL